MLVAVILSGLLGLRNSSRLAGVTITIVMLVQKAGSRWELALGRSGEVLLGIVVALAVSTLVFPDRARARLRGGLGQEFLVLCAFFEAILEGSRGAPSGNLPSLREDALAMLRGNNLLLEAALNEPSGGPGWWPRMERGAGHALAIWPLVIRCAGGFGVLRRRQPPGRVCAATRIVAGDTCRRDPQGLSSGRREHSRMAS